MLGTEQMLKKYEKTIHKAAHEYYKAVEHNPRLSYADMVAEATAIAIKAANTFDESRGTLFITHLTNALDNELRKFIIRNYYDLNVSEHAEREEYKEHGNLDRLRREATASARIDFVISDSKDGSDGGSTTLGDVLPSGYPSPEEILIKNESLDILREELDHLPERERYVITGRWFENKTLIEIAREMNVSKQTIHGWEKSGIERLGRRVRMRLGNELY